MTLTAEVLIAIVGLMSIIASGGALFVSMKLKSELMAFRCEFLAELDSRFLRSKEYIKDTAGVAVEEKQYRADTKEKIAGVEVEVIKVRDHADELREIVVKLHPTTAPRAFGKKGNQ